MAIELEIVNGFDPNDNWLEGDLEFYKDGNIHVFENLLEIKMALNSHKWSTTDAFDECVPTYPVLGDYYEAFDFLWISSEAPNRLIYTVDYEAKCRD